MLNKWYNVIINSPLIYVFYIQNELIAIEIDTAKEQRLCVICQVIHVYEYSCMVVWMDKLDC